ncbi:hypothetical protein HG531_002563 [Fusarium graminearum]|nr:hypothetical protein HG531_002563 [Fusarium graminearum]
MLVLCSASSTLGVLLGVVRTNSRKRIVWTKEAKVHTLANMRQHTHAVKGQTSNVEFKRNTHEARHGIIEPEPPRIPGVDVPRKGLPKSWPNISFLSTSLLNPPPLLVDPPHGAGPGLILAGSGGGGGGDGSSSLSSSSSSKSSS